MTEKCVTFNSTCPALHTRSEQGFKVFKTRNLILISSIALQYPLLHVYYHHRQLANVIVNPMFFANWPCLHGEKHNFASSQWLSTWLTFKGRLFPLCLGEWIKKQPNEKIKKQQFQHPKHPRKCEGFHEKVKCPKLSLQTVQLHCRLTPPTGETEISQFFSKKF